MSCCAVCSGGAPRAIAVVLDGYTGVLHQDLNNSAGHPDLDTQDSLHPSWTQFGSVPAPYILYYSGGDGASCTFSLINGPGLVRNDQDDTNAGLIVHSYRPTLTATLTLTGGVPTVTVNAGGFSTFSGAVAASAPIDCTAINDVSLPLTANSCAPLSDGANATCRVWLLGPAKDCTANSPPCSPPANGGGAPTTPNRYSHLRQPGGTKKCFSDNECDCCVCNLDGKPDSFQVTFNNWTTGAQDSGCSPFNGTKWTLPWLFNDSQGNCFYGVVTSIFSYYLLLKIGFAGDPSDQCVYAGLYMLHNYDPSMGANLPTPDFLFELDHIEYCWLENIKQIPWRGKGTFPCLSLEVDLPMQIDNGEAGDGAFCDEDQINGPSVHISPLGGATEPGGCCCGGDTKKGSPDRFVEVCFGSDDPSCPLSGVLAELQKNGANWTGTVLLDNGQSLNVTLAWSGGNWTVSFDCGGSGGSANFASLNSPAQTVSGGDCCAGNVTVALSTSAGGCPGKLTQGAIGQCGCVAGEAPPTFLIVELPQMTDATPAGANTCAPCRALIMDCAGAWVSDFIGKQMLGGCMEPCVCVYHTNYQLGPCDCFGDTVNPMLSVIVNLSDDGTISVECATTGDPSNGGIGTWTGSFAARQCAPLDVWVPFASAANWAFPGAPAIHVYSL